MIQSFIQTCDVKSATVTLVEEDLLTRTAITPDTIDGYAEPVAMAAGDPRLARLNDLLHGMTLKAATRAQLEMRILMRLTCADGTTRLVAGSKADDDGTMHLNIDGKMAKTDASLRRALEAMTR